MKWYIHLLAAAILVFTTMGDDALYLVVYLTSSRFSKTLRLWNAFIFCAVLQATVWLSYGAVFLFGKTLSERDIQPTKIRLASIAAGITWLLSFFLFLKWCRKRIKKRRTEPDADIAYHAVNHNHVDIGKENAKMGDLKDSGNGNRLVQNGDNIKSIHTSTKKDAKVHFAEYGTCRIDIDTNSKVGCNGNSEYREKPNIKTVVKRYSSDLKRKSEEFFEVTSTVLVLAIMGALDELCYFPTLLMSDTFDVMELSLGAFLASVAMVSVLAFALPKVKPLLEILDSIPLFIIVCIMSIVMTIDAISLHNSD